MRGKLPTGGEGSSLHFSPGGKLLMISWSGQRPGLCQSAQHIGCHPSSAIFLEPQCSPLQSPGELLWSWHKLRRPGPLASSSAPLSWRMLGSAFSRQFLLLEWLLRLLSSNTFHCISISIKLNSPNLFIDHGENTWEIPLHKCWITLTLFTDQSLSEWFKINVKNLHY